MSSLLQFVCGFLFLRSIVNCPEQNQQEFDIACEKECDTIRSLVRFWKQKDDNLYEANARLENAYNDLISAFYAGELEHYPGPAGPVGINFAIHIGRTFAHHTATYYDSNLLKNIEFDVFPDGKCKTK